MNDDRHPAPRERDAATQEAAQEAVTREAGTHDARPGTAQDTAPQAAPGATPDPAPVAAPPPRFPGYDVLAKWDSPSFDDVTRGVLAQRLDNVPPRRWLTPAEWDTLDAINARLLPQPDRAAPIPITPWIDAMLHDNRGEGYRHPDMPPLRDAWRQGLAAVDDEARRRHDRPFAALDAARQDALLHAIEAGHVTSPRWQGLDVARFFIHHLVKTAAGIYYAHPAAWNEIGFGGPAAPRGYVRLGFDARDPWEAKETP